MFVENAKKHFAVTALSAFGSMSMKVGVVNIERSIIYSYALNIMMR